MKEFKLTPPIIPEKWIENGILKFLWVKRLFAWKNQSTGVYDEKIKSYRRPMNPLHIKGVADILGIAPVVITPEMVGKTIGRFMAIEVKSAKGRLSPEQQTFLEKVKALGGLAFVARSIDEVHARLKEEGYVQD